MILVRQVYTTDMIPLNCKRSRIDTFLAGMVHIQYNFQKKHQCIQIYTALLGMIHMEYMIQLTAHHNLLYTVLESMMNINGIQDKYHTALQGMRSGHALGRHGICLIECKDWRRSLVDCPLPLNTGVLSFIS